ncbi:helix-turn-helix domain-containing protein [Streptomyces griseofuscus]|uniref:helix-turn-helix domain-containing protein n=1 Tax=Streptomyces griseofuscus TaxID=146922 RepID=UPI003822F894
MHTTSPQSDRTRQFDPRRPEDPPLLGRGATTAPTDWRGRRHQRRPAVHIGTSRGRSALSRPQAAGYPVRLRHTADHGSGWQDGGLTEAEIARAAGTSDRAVSFYLSGRRHPQAEVLPRLAHAVGVADPLGLCGLPKDGERIAHLCVRAGKSRVMVAAELGWHRRPTGGGRPPRPRPGQDGRPPRRLGGEPPAAWLGLAGAHPVLHQAHGREGREHQRHLAAGLLYSCGPYPGDPVPRRLKEAHWVGASTSERLLPSGSSTTTWRTPLL